MAFDVPRDPTAPPDPVVIARPRPGSVTVAGILMHATAGLGLLASGGLIVAAAGVVEDFRTHASAFGASRDDIDATATAIRSALLTSGLAAFVLAVVTALLGRGVLRRNEAARIGALVVMIGSLGCALIRTSVTAFGGRIDWTMGVRQSSPTLAANMGQAYGDAMPGWFAGIGGGLTDLQSLGYIAVAVLLLLPVSQEYFRTRVIQADQGPSL